MLKKTVTRILAIIPLFLCFSCLDDDRLFYSPSELIITKIEFYEDEKYENTILDFPYGLTQITFPPNFNYNDPSTWTGDVAQYVRHNRVYIITYYVENAGGSGAYGAELDLYLKMDNGEEVELETIYLGSIGKKESIKGTKMRVIANTELVECRGELYWYE
jgi:hypothetical protein